MTKEIRNPNDEGKTCDRAGTGSSFGFRHCPESPHVGCYDLMNDLTFAIRNLLVVGQIALTVILLTGAGLLIRTFAALKEVNPGFRPQGVLSLRLGISRSKYGGDDKVASFCKRILEQVRALPGVEAAGMGNRLPLEGSSGLSTIEFARSNQQPGNIEATDETTVTPEYFQAMGIPLLKGRSFTEQDTTNAPL